MKFLIVRGMPKLIFVIGMAAPMAMGEKLQSRHAVHVVEEEVENFLQMLRDIFNLTSTRDN